MTVYLDTSVLMAAFTEEAHSDRAQTILAEASDPVISDWAAAEFSAAIRAKASRGELKTALVPRLDLALDELVRRSARAMSIERQDHRDARVLVMQDGRVRAPDALHIVAARRADASLATLDITQARAAESFGLSLFRP